MDTELFCSSRWKYRGEGHSSLVLFHTEEPRVVLRLKKMDVKPGILTSGKAREEIMEYQRDFMQKIMRPLVGERYVPRQRIVSLPRDFVEKMSERTEKERPRNRLVKVINSDACVGLLMPDVCFLPGLSSKASDIIADDRVIRQIRMDVDETNLMELDAPHPYPTFCIEIKPKCGFLPPPYDSPLRSCKFCLFQRLKVKRGKWKRVSEYCPLDLFSGNTCRVQTALRGLLSTPQNNLRVFQDGKCLFAEDIESSSPLEQLDKLKSVLRPFFPGEDPTGSLMTILSRILTESSSSLSTHSTPICKQSAYNSSENTAANNTGSPCSLLRKLLDIQQYDRLGSPGMFPLYSKLKNDCTAQPDDHVSWKMDLMEPHLHSTTEDEVDGTNSVLPEIERYLLAATAKDCSIMIALRPQTSLGQLKTNQISYDYSLSVVDLDSKGVWRVEKYHEEDAEILQAFISSA